MHLADGIVTEPTLLVGLNLAGAGAVAIATRKADLEDTRTLIWTGLLSAFVLAAQAVNVPLLPGTSAHVIGATLVTFAVGPARGIVALAAVLVIQALLLGDGGITSLGVNVLTLAVLPSIAVEGAARIFGRSGRRLSVAAVAGTVTGSVASASLLAGVLVAGAGASAPIAFPWLVGVHGLTGLAEGLMTAAALRTLERRVPGLISDRSGGPLLREDSKAGFRVALGWTAVALGVATALLPIASNSPDALERLVGAQSARR